jgi:hypothetical protein
LLGKDGTLERVPLGAYSTEAVLQELVENYPELLSGEQIDPDDPPRWLLIKKEAGIPDAEQSADRWSADHLLLDQNARPTIVETKRSSDTLIRREVIGQMLDYAANATVYWPTDRIRSLASETCGGTDKLDEKIRKLIGSENSNDPVADIESYWRRVDNNLRSGELRLLFVADELPRELRRVIEFLNEHMPRIEVLGVEVRQFSGQNMRALVPRVIGQTERARQDKVSSPARKISLNTFIENCPEWCRSFFETLFEEADREGFKIVPGTKGFSVCALQNDGTPVSLIWGFPPGSYNRPSPSLDIELSYLSPFENIDVIVKSVTDVAPFKLGGTTSLMMPLEPGNLNSGRDALQYIWQIGRKIRAT